MQVRRLGLRTETEAEVRAAKQQQDGDGGWPWQFTQQARWDFGSCHKPCLGAPCQQMRLALLLQLFTTAHT